MEDDEIENYSDSSAASSLQRDQDVPGQWSEENLDETAVSGFTDSTTLNLRESNLQAQVDFEDECEEPVEEEANNAEESACVYETESDMVSETGDESDLDSSRSDTKRKKFTHADRVRTLHLRRKLNQLDNILGEKETRTQKLREELQVCQKRIETLTRERDSMESEIDLERANENIWTQCRDTLSETISAYDLDNVSV